MSISYARFDSQGQDGEEEEEENERIRVREQKLHNFLIRLSRLSDRTGLRLTPAFS